MNIDLSLMNTQELEALSKVIEQEVDKRRTGRRNELIDNVIAAITALHKEFPHTSINIEYKCPYCDCYDEINILKYFGNLSRDDFGGW